MIRSVKHYAALVAVIVLTGTLAWANRDNIQRVMLGGFQVGTAATVGTAANKVTTMLAATTAAIDFASKTITCENSAATTVTGAANNDPCFIGPTVDGGTSHGVFTCWCTTNACYVKHCAVGTADDPPSQTFSLRVISNQ